LQRIISLLLALTAVFALSPACSAAEGRVFEDVSPTHWGSAYILRAYQEKVINGIAYDPETGRRYFGPEDPMTIMELGTMLVRALYPEQTAAPSDPWFAAPLETANRYRLFRGLSADRDGGINSAVTRKEMALVLMNVLASRGYRTEGAAQHEMEETIPDWRELDELYRDAVAALFGLGILTGVDELGTFDGDTVVTRAQGTAVCCRISDYIYSRRSAAPRTPSDFTPGLQSGAELILDSPFLPLGGAQTLTAAAIFPESGAAEYTWRVENDGFGQAGSPAPVEITPAEDGAAVLRPRAAGVAKIWLADESGAAITRGVYAVVLDVG